MNVIGSDGSNKVQMFLNYYARMAESIPIDLIVRLFGCCIIYWGGSRGKYLIDEFCERNLLTVYLFCYVEKRLPEVMQKKLTFE